MNPGVVVVVVVVVAVAGNGIFSIAVWMAAD